MRQALAAELSKSQPADTHNECLPVVILSKNNPLPISMDLYQRIPILFDIHVHCG
jgi:hypothetical protein